jgi:hypothetical protein
MTRFVKPASGYLSQSSKTVHFGLGDRSQIDRLKFVGPEASIKLLRSQLSISNTILLNLQGDRPVLKIARSVNRNGTRHALSK